jgi:Rod binding domain-containing protein
MQVGLTSGDAVTGQAGYAPQPRLVRAAHEFEGQMMKELLKPVTDGDALTGAEDGDSGSGAGSEGALGEFASEALGQALSQRGGLGIASKIVQDLSHSDHRHNGEKVTVNLHSDTVMKSPE